MFSSQILHITTRRAIISLVLCSAPVATFIKHKHSRYNPLFPGQHLCGAASLHRDNPALCRRVHQHLRARGPAGVGARARRDQGLRRVGQLPQRDRQVAGQISRISTISTYLNIYTQRQQHPGALPPPQPDAHAARGEKPRHDAQPAAGRWPDGAIVNQK